MRKAGIVASTEVVTRLGKYVKADLGLAIKPDEISCQMPIMLARKSNNQAQNAITLCFVPYHP